MITSASGYECVDVTGFPSGTISGDILPVRDNRGDGSWRAMKYEDLLFLQEAFWERKAICDESYYPVDKSAQPKSRILNRTNFNDAVYFPSMIIGPNGISYNPEYIDADKSTTFNSVDVTQTSIRDVLLSLGFEFTMDAAPNSGRLLSADDVRHAFWRTKKLKRSLFRMYTLGGMYDCTYTHTYKGEPNDGYSYTDTGAWTGELYYTVPSNSIAAHSLNLRVSFTPNTVTLPRWRASASSWRASKWLYLCKATHSYRGSSSAEIRYKLVSRTAAGSSPISNMALFTSQLASSVGFPYDPSPYDTENDGYRLEVVDAAFITEHAFPAEIDSLNWNWQPT